MSVKSELKKAEPNFPFVSAYGGIAWSRHILLNRHDCRVYTDAEVTSESFTADKVTLTITAEDGTEFPRIHKSDSVTYLVLADRILVYWNEVYDEDGAYSENEFIGSSIIDLASRNGKPLPPGTVTTLVVGNGEIECEIKEPEGDWLPVEMTDDAACAFQLKRRGQNGELLGIHINSQSRVFNSHEHLNQLIDALIRFRDEQEGGAK